MPQQQVLDCLVSENIDLDKEWSREDVTTDRIIQLLIEHNAEFNDVRKGWPIEKFEGTLISEGRAFMSRVFKICITFANKTEYSVVLKVSQHKQWKNYADNGGSGESSPERDENDNLREKQKEMMEIGERYHNVECCFYKNFPPIPGCPTPKVFYLEEIDAYRDGLFLMENLADTSAPLGFYSNDATAEHLYSVARCAANLHYYGDRDVLKQYWSSTVGYVYLDLFVDEFQHTGFPLLKPYPDMIELLDQITPVFDKDFCYYAVLNKPREYNALVCCHGDMQPNNILFSTKDGQTTSEIKVILDWQLIFGGNPFTDLVRFLIGVIDAEVRKEVDYKAFDVYYSELERLYAKDGRQPSFNRDQALELYELSICEQTGSYIILMPFVEQRKHLLNLELDRIDVFAKRTVEAAKLIIPLLEKHGLHQFGKSVDWRQMMHATI